MSERKYFEAKGEIKKILLAKLKERRAGIDALHDFYAMHGLSSQNWHVDEDGEITCDGAVIGSVLQADDFPCLDEEDSPAIEAECKAIGQLIADAPKLLQALEAALRQWNAYHALQNDHDIEDEKSEEADIYRACSQLTNR